MSKNNHPTLFENVEDYGRAMEEWQGMPEFKHEDLRPYSSLTIHFKSKEDREDFSKLIGQKITPKTLSLWYPKAEIMIVANKRYVDEP